MTLAVIALCGWEGRQLDVEIGYLYGDIKALRRAPRWVSRLAEPKIVVPCTGDYCG